MSGKIIRSCCVAIIVFCVFCAGYSFAGNPSADYPWVTIENISYLGDNKYKINMKISNPSQRTVVLKEYGVTFQVQTEILGRWKELNARRDKGDGSVKLSPLEAHETMYVLNIPPDSPALYKNSEGDINMMIKYHIRFFSGSGQDLRRHYGESSCWITPKTDNWILREGM